jgi:hypothetical protein
MELGQKPSNYVKNMEILATIAGVHPKQMSLVNPVTFAERHFRQSEFLTRNLQKILGNDTYWALREERCAHFSISANWAYHKKEPIPPYVEPAPKPAVAPVAEPATAPVAEPMVPSAAVIKEGFGQEFKAIVDFMTEINSLHQSSAREAVAVKMFKYIMTIEPFLRRYPKFYETCLAKAREFKAQPISEELRQVLLQTEDFLNHLREPAALEPAAHQYEEEEYWCSSKNCTTCDDKYVMDREKFGTTYHVKNTDEYGDFLEVVKEYVGGDCWAIKVNDEVLFDCYKDLSLKEQLQASILRDKMVDCPHLLFTDMFIKKKDGTIIINMYSQNTMVVKITYKAADETLTMIVTSK